MTVRFSNQLVAELYQPPRLTRLAGGGGAEESSTGERTRRPRPPGSATDSAADWKGRHETLLADCGISSQQAWKEFAAEVRAARAAAGQPLTRWSAAHLLSALDLAVRGRGWPAERAGMALVHVAADPGTRSPARLAEAGPWWDDPPGADPDEPADVAALEAELDVVPGLRV